MQINAKDALGKLEQEGYKLLKRWKISTCPAPHGI